MNLSDSYGLIPDHCVFVVPSAVAWQYAVLVHGACILLGVIPCSFLLYRWRKAPSNPRSAPACCILVGVVAAVAVVWLRPTIEWYAPDPHVAFFGPFVASTFGLGFFKACNAGMGTFPEGADRDLRTWLMWVAMIPGPAFVKGNTVPATPMGVWTKFWNACGKLLVLFFLLTILVPTDGFVETAFIGDGWIASSQLLTDHINGFVHTWLFYAFASFCLDVSTLSDCFLSGGLGMNAAYKNPLLASRSLREFWGTRWNQPVHNLLKRTIYVPLLRSQLFGTQAAASLTFLGSGLLHEYTFWIHNHKAITAGIYTPGSVTGFFLLMGGLVWMESWAWHRCLPQYVRKILRRLPSLVTASLVCFFVGGLSERYFLRSWIASGFVEMLARLLPHLDCRTR